METDKLLFRTKNDTGILIDDTGVNKLYDYIDSKMNISIRVIQDIFISDSDDKLLSDVKSRESVTCHVSPKSGYIKFMRVGYNSMTKRGNDWRVLFNRYSRNGFQDLAICGPGEVYSDHYYAMSTGTDEKLAEVFMTYLTLKVPNSMIRTKNSMINSAYPLMDWKNIAVLPIAIGVQSDGKPFEMTDNNIYSYLSLNRQQINLIDPNYGNSNIVKKKKDKCLIS